MENRHNIPMRTTLLDGNGSEGGCLLPSLEHIHGNGILPKVMYIDGGYTSYENIAIAQVRYGVELVYKIEADWVINPKGFDENLMRLYQKHWKDTGFRTYATLEDILRFLLDHGHLEEVGAHFRNMRMAEYEEAPDSYLDVYHQRNIGEGFNGYVKEQMDLERDIPKGKERVRMHTLSRLLSVVVAALTRAQNGVYEDLGSVAYITK